MSIYLKGLNNDMLNIIQQNYTIKAFYLPKWQKKGNFIVPFFFQIKYFHH